MKLLTALLALAVGYRQWPRRLAVDCSLLPQGLANAIDSYFFPGTT